MTNSKIKSLLLTALLLFCVSCSVTSPAVTQQIEKGKPDFYTGSVSAVDKGKPDMDIEQCEVLGQNSLNKPEIESSSSPQLYNDVQLEEDAAKANPSLEEILSFYGATSEVLSSEVVDDITFSRRHYALLVEGESSSAIKLDFQYPELSGVKSKEVEQVINLMLFDVCFKVFGDGVTLSTAKSIMEEAVMYAEYSPSSTDLVAQVDYEIVGFSLPYISVHYTGHNVAAGGRINNFEQFLTVDVEAAKYIYLPEVVNFETFEETVMQGDFDVLSGGYMPGGWTGSEMAVPFMDSIKKYMDEEVLREAHHFFSNRWDSGKSSQSVNVDGVEYHYEEYDCITSKNFAMNDNCIYVRFSFLDSLDGYVVLTIQK